MYWLRILATVVLHTEYIIHTFLNSHNFSLFVENRLWKNTSLIFSLLFLHVYLLSVSIFNSIFIPLLLFFPIFFPFFVLHLFHIRLCVYFSLVLERLFRLIFALHLIIFLLLYLLLMYFSHTVFAFTSISLNFLTRFPFLNFLSILQNYTRTQGK